MTAEQLMAKRAAELSGEGQVAFAQALGSGKENELLKQQAEAAERREREQREAASRHEADLMGFVERMADKIKDTATSVSGAQQAVQQQRLEDQRQRADEYRADAQRQQDRMDRVGDQALDYTTRAHQTDSQSFAQAMGGTPQGFQQMPPQGYQQPVQPQYQQPVQQQYQQMPPQQPAAPGTVSIPPTSATPEAPQVRHCPACGAEVPEGEMFCGECGNRM